MGRLLRLVIYLALLAIVVAPVALVLLGLEREPLVARAAKLDLRDLKSAQALAQRFDPRQMPPGRDTVVRATAGELNTILKVALAGLPGVAGRAVVTRYGVIAGVTVETPLPANPLGRFVNLRAAIAPSRTGLEVSRLAVGALEIPPRFVRPAMTLALDYWLGAGKGGPVLDSVRSVQIGGTMVTVAFRPPSDLVKHKKAAAGRQARIDRPNSMESLYAGIDRRTARAPLFRDAGRR